MALWLLPAARIDDPPGPPATTSPPGLLRATLALAFGAEVPPSPGRGWLAVQVSRLTPAALTQVALAAGVPYAPPGLVVAADVAHRSLEAARSALHAARGERAGAEAVRDAAVATAAGIERRMSLRQPPAPPAADAAPPPLRTA